LKEIELSRGLVAIVDDEDYEWLSASRWTYLSCGYGAKRAAHPLIPGKITMLYMHRIICGLTIGDRKYVDHINGNRLDNRRENLRTCTNAENMRNRGKTASNTSGYKGVYRGRQPGRWRALIMVDGETISLGQYDTPEEAHEAYRKAATEFHGDFAGLG